MRNSGFIRGTLVSTLYLAAILGLIVFAISRGYPKVGHDYGFFIPRLLDTYLHYKVNGVAIQWYSANFGAGTPAYPNPQYLQFSLPQISMFVINPWLALMFSLVTYAVIGFLCLYFFLHDEMGWINAACVLGASFLLANGFFIEHAIVGHVGFQTFPLLGAIIFLTFTKRLGFLPAGILIGLLVALIVNQAGFVVLIICLLALLITLPMMYLIHPEIFRPQWYATLLTAGLFAILLSLSKVSAVMAFMRFFPRVIEDHYGQTYLQGIAGIGRQLIGFDIIAPYYLLTGTKLEGLSAFFQQGAGAQFGLWEMDMALSPGLLLLLAFGLGYGIISLLKTRPVLSWKKGIAILILCLGIWLTADLTLAQGWLYNVVKPLPVLRSLHANVRFASALILPLALLGAYVCHMIFDGKKWAGTAAVLLVGLSTLIMLSLYLLMPGDLHLLNFNLKSALPVYPKIDNGWNFTLQNVAEITDMQVFVEEDSNLASQDPMFGYQGEFFKPKVTVGPILAVQDGYYNLTNPAGYVFPEENNLQPFGLFREDQKANLELFINHRPPKLEISGWQRFADVMSLATLVGSVLYLSYASIKGGVKVWQMNAR
jgi:hypothetical protein